MKIKLDINTLEKISGGQEFFTLIYFDKNKPAALLSLNGFKIIFNPQESLQVSYILSTEATKIKLGNKIDLDPSNLKTYALTPIQKSSSHPYKSVGILNYLTKLNWGNFDTKKIKLDINELEKIIAGKRYLSAVDFDKNKPFSILSTNSLEIVFNVHNNDPISYILEILKNEPFETKNYVEIDLDPTLAKTYFVENYNF